jgi:hypothetical protein
MSRLPVAAGLHITRKTMPHELKAKKEKTKAHGSSSMVFAPFQLANVDGRKNHCIVLLPVMCNWFA